MNPARLLLPFALLSLSVGIPRPLGAAELRPTLQIINGSSQPIDIFWLKSDTERVPNGSVAPGKDAVITTTLGHRFAVVGRDDKTTATSPMTPPPNTFYGIGIRFTARPSPNGSKGWE